MTENKSSVAQSAENWDFKTIETPKTTQWLKLGTWILSIADGKYVVPTGTNKEGQPRTGYLEVTFAGDAGQVVEKYYITPKSLGRLQYLHLMLTGKNCEKPFKSGEDVGAYYEAMCKSEKIRAKKLYMTIAGEEGDNNKIYGRLPFSDYILDEDLVKKSGFTEGAFDKNSPQYEFHLKKSIKNLSHTTDSVILSEIPAGMPKSNDDDNQDLPF